ncbi:MAG: hypothetical protein IJS32_06885 [Kiritimatiellae bacterium]|nr:hypothetical protein [Kiritimatiellia bacterium]
MKKTLNLELLEFHVREASQELKTLLERIGAASGKGGDGSRAWSKWPFSEGALEASLEHAYHHLNFAWNVRFKTWETADAHFDRDEKFPKAFTRFWPKSLLKKRKRRKKTTGPRGGGDGEAHP